MCEKLIVRKDVLKLQVAFKAAAALHLSYSCQPEISAPANHQDCNKVMEVAHIGTWIPSLLQQAGWAL